ncbi:hypothetical protein BB560_003075 [Smittium megazygosporum]|uniref:Uncharacterized protein n=1 Tax=Smittium megazygosporum TaxID=133381 RepID=A0A2T9ZD03_9FUNG|nr:hypothetical protein BB560_003075 [Smittium megazygosporum]
MKLVLDKRSEAILKRQLSTIDEGDFYEGHQALRTVQEIANYIRAYHNGFSITVDDVADILHLSMSSFLYAGAKELLKHDQVGSVIDLLHYIIKIYKEQNIPITEESRERITSIMIELPTNDKEILSVIIAATNWSKQLGNNPGGDPILHHFFGTFLSAAPNYYEAEKHFLFGTLESSMALGRMLFAWSKTLPNCDKGVFLCRGVFQYLALGNILFATNCYDAFLKAAKKDGEITVQMEAETEYGNSKMEYIESSISNGFCALVISAVKKSDRNPLSPASKVFENCRKRYLPVFGETEESFAKVLDEIAELYFGIKVQKQVNLLNTLMNSLFAPNNGGAIEN